MHRLKYHLIGWFICGVIAFIIDPVCGEHLQAANETGAQSIRTRERQHQHQHQSQYQYAKYKQQPNRGRSNGLNELRKNLTQQKLWERQGDDPDQNSVHRSPIHLIHEKIQQSDVSTIVHIAQLNDKTLDGHHDRPDPPFAQFIFVIVLLPHFRSLYLCDTFFMVAQIHKLISSF